MGMEPLTPVSDASYTTHEGPGVGACNAVFPCGGRPAQNTRGSFTCGHIDNSVLHNICLR